MASIYRRGETWYIRYFLGGRRIYRSLRTTSRREAEQAKRQVEARLTLTTPGARIASGAVVLTELWRRWQAWAETRIAPATVEGYHYAVQAWEAVYPGRRIASVKPADVQHYQERRLADARTPKTVNNELVALRAIINRAIREQWYGGRNPFSEFTPLPREQRRPRWLSVEEIERVLDAAELYSRPMLLFAALCIYAGLRKGEAVAARWEWIDWDAGLLHVQQDGAFSTKSRRERTIPLHSRLRAILEPYRQQEGYVVAPDAVQGKHRYRYDLKAGLGAVVGAAGVPWCTAHTLRHTFASQLVSAGVDLYKVSVWLGHANVTTTQIYAHLRPQDADIERLGSVASAVGAALRGGSGLGAGTDSGWLRCGCGGAD